MPARKRRTHRDIERDYPKRELVIKLRRLADCIEQDLPFRIQIAGVRVTVPPAAKINLEHERTASEEEIEFQLKWKL